MPEVTQPPPPEHPLGHISESQLVPTVQVAVHAQEPAQSTLLQPPVLQLTEHGAPSPQLTSPQALLAVHATVHAA